MSPNFTETCARELHTSLTWFAQCAQVNSPELIQEAKAVCFNGATILLITSVAIGAFYLMAYGIFGLGCAIRAGMSVGTALFARQVAERSFAVQEGWSNYLPQYFHMPSPWIESDNHFVFFYRMPYLTAWVETFFPRLVCTSTTAATSEFDGFWDR